MEPMEVIDLSSDDENSPPKKGDVGSLVIAQGKKKVGNEDVEIVYNPVKKQKRTIDMTNGQMDTKIKKIRLSKEEDHPEIVTNLLNKKREISLHKITKIKPQLLSSQCTTGFFEFQTSPGSQNKISSSSKTNENTTKLLNNNSQFGNKLTSPNGRDISRSFKINEGASSSRQITMPQLLIKNKIKVSEIVESSLGPSEEVFESFLDAYRSQDSGKEMEKIVSKLKKRFKKLQPSYVKSGSFIQLIRQKTNLILNNPAKLYLHVSKVMDEMKVRQVETTSIVKKNTDKFNVKVLKTDDQSEFGAMSEENANEVEVDARDRDRLKALEKAMRRCERYINKCEMAEVNFNDENDSHYIMAEKYKCRMVELYNKYCEITGERPDADRPYLRPKYLSFTQLPSLNNAITSFVNMKITKMNKSLVHTKKTAGQLRLRDALIFPDYVDILNCVKKCNEEQNLQLNKTKQESIAEAAFSELGAHLQRCRRLDYYDTFSLYLEKESCDPASEDKSLAEQLNKNQEVGRKKLEQVFEEFVEKQNAAKITENGSCAEKEEDAETGDESSEDTDDKHSDESENEEISIEILNDSDESATNKQDDLHHEANGNVELDKPQNDLNPKSTDDVELEKPQEKIVQKGNNNKVKKPKDDLSREADNINEVDKSEDNINGSGDSDVQQNKLLCDSNQKDENDDELDKSYGDFNEKGGDNVELKKPEDDLHQNRVEGVKLDKHVDINKENIENEELYDAEDSLSVEKIVKRSIKIGISGPRADRVVDNIEVTKDKDTKMMSAQTLLQQTKIIHINETRNETRDPSDTGKTDPLKSLIQEPTSTVATCKVNLMQTAKTLEMDLVDRCSPTIPANNTKVIDAPAVATTVELIDEEEQKKPTLRVRQFAKPPGSWKDFQSPTRSLIKNTEPVGEMTNPDTVRKNMNKTLPVEHQTSKFITMNKQTPVGRTVQVKNAILRNLKNKKSTVMIPMNLNKSIPHISVKTVTNNLTFNFNNQVQSEPKMTLVSHGLKPAQNRIDINESEKIMTHCGNVGIISIDPNKGTTSIKSNPIQKVQTNSQQIFPIKRPVNTVRLVAQQTTGAIIGDKRFQIIPSKSGVNQEKTIVRHIPVINEHGKQTVLRLVKHSPGVKPQNIVVPANATSIRKNQTTLSPDQRPNSNWSANADPNLKCTVSNSIKKISPFTLLRQPSDKVDEVYETPNGGVPTYVIE